MRLLFLTNYYPPHHIGGYEELCAEVAEGLRGRGHTILVLTSHRGIHQRGVSEEGVYRILHPEVDTHPLGANVSFFIGRKQRLHENLQFLRQTIADFCPDILLAWGMWNLPRQLLAHAENSGQRVVYYIADYWPTLPDAYTLHWREPARHRHTSLLKKIVGQVAIRILSREKVIPSLQFDYTICVSQAVRKQLIRLSPQFEQARVIYNGIDLRMFSDAQQSRRQLSDSLLLLYAGRLSPEKGVRTVIEALGLARHVCNTTLTILGGGDAEYRIQLQDLARQLKIADNITFRERISREEMPQALRSFDVLVAPSLWEEPLPRAVQEGMASGMVVLASRVGGIPEIIENGVNGLLFQPGNANELAQHIITLAKDKNLRISLAEQGVQTVKEKFTINRMLDELEIYLKTVAN